VTVVELVQGGVVGLLFALDLHDVGFETPPFLFNDMAVARVATETHVGPLEHKMAVSHLRPPTIHGAPMGIAVTPERSSLRTGGALARHRLVPAPS
jgi:hypothetical protein